MPNTAPNGQDSSYPNPNPNPPVSSAPAPALPQPQPQPESQPQPTNYPIATPNQLPLSTTDPFSDSSLGQRGQQHPSLQPPSIYPNSSALMLNQLQTTGFTLPPARPSSSAPAHLSLFDFHPEDISLYDYLNSQPLPLSAPLPQSIDPSKHHLTLSLEDNPGGISSLHNDDHPQMLPQSGSFGFYNDPVQRPSHPSMSTQQGSLNHFSLLPQSLSGSELPLSIDQPHPSSAATSSYPSHLLDLQPQPTLQDRLRVLDLLETHPSSAEADPFNPNDLEPTPSTHDSHALDLPSNSLQALFFNSQGQSENQMLLDQPFSTVPIDAFDTPVVVSEKSNGTPHARSKSARLKYNRTATSTLSQDFRKRKDWTKRLVEDIEDVIQVVTSTGELLFLSESMSRLTGFQTSELLGSNLFDWCFEDEDSVNLKREMKNCTLYGNQLNLYCRFKKKDSDGFIILEMSGHMTDIKGIEEETGNVRALYITGRLYPTSCGRLMDNFLELMIENEMMMRRLRSREKGSKGWCEAEEEELDDGLRKTKNKRRISEPTKIDPIVDEDEESEEEQDQNAECINHQIIGRDYPSRPRKRPKKDKIDFLCLDCGVTQSPEWRKGPMGRKTLCNACGLRYAKKGQVINNNMVTNKK